MGGVRPRRAGPQDRGGAQGETAAGLAVGGEAGGERRVTVRTKITSAYSLGELPMVAG